MRHSCTINNIARIDRKELSPCASYEQYLMALGLRSDHRREMRVVRSCTSGQAGRLL